MVRGLRGHGEGVEVVRGLRGHGDGLEVVRGLRELNKRM